jgi:hypothetical protein
MPKVTSRQTRSSLALKDPREYGLVVPTGGLAELLFNTNSAGAAYRAHPRHAIEPVGLNEAIGHSLAKLDDAPLYQALSAAQNADTYALTIADVVRASCRRVLGDTVHVTFAVPLTLHCATWPVRASRAAEDWLDFDAISDAIGLPSMTAGIRNLTVLPHLFTLEALNKLPWSTWYALTELMPRASAKVMTGLPTSRPFDPPTDEHRAQSRVIIGGFSCSIQTAERFQRNSVLNQGENAHVLTTLLQTQLGQSHGLMVVAGTPSLAPVAISEAQHMLNCAQLRCFLDVVGVSLEEVVTLQAETVKREDGEGSLRFKTKTRSCEWVLQKAEPWYGQKRHWQLLISGVMAPYLKVQLGLNEDQFDPGAMFDDDEDELFG